MPRRQPLVKAHVEGIERAAVALWQHQFGNATLATLDTWEMLDESLREMWRERARVVTAAYTGGTQP